MSDAWRQHFASPILERLEHWRRESYRRTVERLDAERMTLRLSPPEVVNEMVKRWSSLPRFDEVSAP